MLFAKPRKPSSRDYRLEFGRQTPRIMLPDPFSCLHYSGFRSFQEVVQAAHPEPPVTVRLQHHAMAAPFVRKAVVLRQQIHEGIIVSVFCGESETHLARLTAKVVNADHRVARAIRSAPRGSHCSSPERRRSRPSRSPAPPCACESCVPSSSAMSWDRAAVPLR